jgi:hypothetical protein
VRAANGYESTGCQAAPFSRVEGLVGQSFAERFIHYTYVWDRRQAPNLDAMPVVGLIEIGLRRSNGDGTPIALSPSDKTGLKRRNFIHLTARMPLVNSEATSRIPEREKIAFRPCVLGS